MFTLVMDDHAVFITSLFFGNTMDLKIPRKIVLLTVTVVFLLSPVNGMCWSPGPYHHYHGGSHHYGDALAWGLVGGLVVGMALANPPPPPPPPPWAYGYPAVPAGPIVYTSPPPIPAGMCRWERGVLDGYGNQLYDQNGQPVRQYTIGSCRYPPH
jgi:hypothetical protein